MKRVKDGISTNSETGDNSRVGAQEQHPTVKRVLKKEREVLPNSETGVKEEEHYAPQGALYTGRTGIRRASVRLIPQGER